MFLVTFSPHHRGVLARPRSGARGYAVRFLGAAQGRAQAQSRRRPQKRGPGTGAGLLSSVFIGVHRWLTQAFLGKRRPSNPGSDFGPRARFR